jgi:dGTPase
MAFRRLKHKTQVFVTPLDDHYVTRLTHTLEVAQIARSIARALNLNEDLTEAIALGHDLGHTPFGHVGEEVLAELSSSGFRHNEQSLRVVDVLEKKGQGLNLTWEVREGILKHSKARADIFDDGFGSPGTLEGHIVKIADSVAYLNHDLADALRAGLITERELPRGTIEQLGDRHSQRINTLVCDIIDSSWEATGEDKSDVVESPSISMSPRIAEATNELREFLFQRVYEVETPETERARGAVRYLYRYFHEHPKALPDDSPHGEESGQAIVDHIASMTDRYAEAVYNSLEKARV